MKQRKTVSVLGFPIDCISWQKAVDQIVSWAEARENRVVCICNTHSLVTAGDDKEFGDLLLASDMNTPDGAPVAWYMRMYGARKQQRVCGPDLMMQCCAALNSPESPSIFLYGSTDENLRSLTSILSRRFPQLKVAGHISPPFRALSENETNSIISQINASGAGLVWVSLGCPKQEKWMGANRLLISAVMVGVGAAFDYHTGAIKRAPMWMRRAGLEWLHRLFSEPRRLWRRYFYCNTQFVLRSLEMFLHTQGNCNSSNRGSLP